MPVPQALIQWLRSRYPKPEIDQVNQNFTCCKYYLTRHIKEWLSECYNYVQSQPGGANLENAKQQVEAQLLASDLRDSTIPHTALPANVGQMENSRLPGPYLVQILALTDIGHSAFQLKNTRQIRQERADMSALAIENENQEEGEEEGPVPDYPRGMLRFELSDGSTLLPAIEYRKLPQLVLGVTPLGCKVDATPTILTTI
jgi:RecQ-mediated genome instability protein 1